MDTTLRDTKTLLLSRKQTFQVRKVPTRESGQEVPWVVNTPVREHNKQFRATYNSLWGSSLDCLNPKTPSLSQEMKCGKRKGGWGEGNQSRSDESVLFFSFSTPIQHSCRLVTTLGAIYQKTLNQYAKLLLIRLQTCIYISAVFFPNISLTPLDSPIPFPK